MSHWTASPRWTRLPRSPGRCSSAPANASSVDVAASGVPINVGGDVILADNRVVQLGTTAVLPSGGCICSLYQTVGPILRGHVVKIVDDGAGNARIANITAADPDVMGVIGVTVDTAAAANDTVRVCIAGKFEAVVQDGVFIDIGYFLEKSDTAGQDGRVTFNLPGVASVGEFAVALSSGTGDTAGTVLITGAYVHNPY